MRESSGMDRLWEFFGIGEWYWNRFKLRILQLFQCKTKWGNFKTWPLENKKIFLQNPEKDSNKILNKIAEIIARIITKSKVHFKQNSEQHNLEIFGWEVGFRKFVPRILSKLWVEFAIIARWKSDNIHTREKTDQNSEKYSSYSRQKHQCVHVFCVNRTDNTIILIW